MNRIFVAVDVTKISSNLSHFLTDLAGKSTFTVKFYTALPADILQSLRKNEPSLLFHKLLSELEENGISYEIETYVRNDFTFIQHACTNGETDLLLSQSKSRYQLHRHWHSKLDKHNTTCSFPPTLIIPAKGPLGIISHITYAVDFDDYDQEIMDSIIFLATIFDAKLTIFHINTPEENRKGTYVESLEKTITDTLDYPKVYYKFFDDKDPFTGIQKFLSNGNTQLLAMINRKELTWKNLFSESSLTRKMATKTSVPLLAFHKYELSEE
ncbi:MAG: hypothetical protein AAF824_15105 [Bacteroidota bacterium]